MEPQQPEPDGLSDESTYAEADGWGEQRAGVTPAQPRIPPTFPTYPPAIAQPLQAWQSPSPQQPSVNMARRALSIGGGILALCMVVAIFFVIASAPTLGTTPTPQVVHYPPTTLADLRGLAAQGAASAIHEVHSESVGLVGVCPQPKKEVIVDPSVTGQQLAEDLLAYFYGQQLDSPCGSLVVAYNHQNEVGNVYTAGRINLDVTDSSGQGNVDPNATNLKYTVTLDIGGILSSQQEYMVTY